MKPVNGLLPRMFIGLIIALVPITVLSIVFPPEGPLFTVYIFVLIVHFFYVLRDGFSVKKRWPYTLVIAVLMSLAAFVIFSDIIITPYSAYISWFKLVAKGRPQSAVAFIFIMTAGFFSAFFSGQVYRHGMFRPLTGIAFTLMYIFAIILSKLVFFILTAALVVFGFAAAGTAFSADRERLRAALNPVFLLIPAALAALPIALNFNPRGSRVIGGVLSPVFHDLTLELFPSFPIIYGTPGFGYGFAEKDLGGRPVLSERGLFKVKSDPGEIIYLRTAVYDSYAENQWFLSRRTAKQSQEEQQQVVASSFLSQAPEGDYTTTELTLVNEFYAMVPHTIDTEYIVVPEGTALDFQRASPRTGFLLNEPLVKGTKTVLYRSENVVVQEDEELLSEVYTAVPPQIHPNIRLTAEYVAGETDRETIANIKSYFQTYFLYTLNVSSPPEGVDFLENFLLESGMGYCVHFATAFVILARMNGIPARYASGFLVVLPNDSETATISGYSSHAWPECYLPGEGWVPVEATPPMQPDAFMDPDFYFRFNPMDHLFTSQQLSAILGSRVPAPAGEEEQEKVKTDINRGLIFAVILVLVLVPAAGLFIVRFVPRYISNKRRIRFWAGKMVKYSEKNNVPGPDTAGWSGWADALIEIGGNGHLRRHAALRGITIIHRTFFTPRRPSRRDAVFVKKMAAKVKKAE